MPQAVFAHDRPVRPPPLAEFLALAERPESDLPYAWRGAGEHPDVLEEWCRLAGRLDERGRLLRAAGAFPLAAADFPAPEPLPHGDGAPERDLALAVSARARPAAWQRLANLVLGGAFFEP